MGLKLRTIARDGPDDKRSAVIQLRQAGFSPTVVIDVGVHKDGTPELYSAFPDAKFVLVEPAAEFAPAINRIVATLKDAELIIAAASDRIGSGTLRITRDSYVHTSLTDVEGEDKDDGIKHDFVEVPVTTVDKICKERKLKGPFLLKVDVDGADLLVLRGSVNTLRNTDVVIVEAPVHKIVERSSFLEQHGFVLWGIVDHMYFDRTLWQVDLIFISSALKNNPRFKPWSDSGFRFA